MGKNGISPGQIPHLVRLTADLFREMNKEIKSPNDNPANKLEENKEMHFVADLLKDLVDTAYPEEEKTSAIPVPCEIEKEIYKELDKELEKIMKVVLDAYPEAFTKGGEF